MPCALAVNPNGETFATYGEDRKIRIFNTITGKIMQTLDDTMNYYVNTAKDERSVISFINLAKIRKKTRKIQFKFGGNLSLATVVSIAAGPFDWKVIKRIRRDLAGHVERIE